MRRETKNGLIAAFVGVVIVGLIVMVLVIKGAFIPAPVSIVSIDQTCEFIRGSTPSGIYNCNNDEGCFAWIQDVFCSTQVSEQTVIFRTNAVDDPTLGQPCTSSGDCTYLVTQCDYRINQCVRYRYYKIFEDKWVSADYLGYGFLEGFEYEVYTSADCTPMNPNYLTEWDKFYICKYYSRGDKLLITYKDNPSTSIRMKPSTNPEIELSVSPTSPYKENGQESYGGIGNVYECEFPYFIDRITSDETKVLKYSSTSAGYIGLSETDAIPLNKGESLELGFQGTINYKEKVCTGCECTRDVCIGTGIQKCENINPETGCGTLSSTVSFCEITGEICIEGVCKLPYIFFITFEDQTGAEKEVFKATDQVSLKLFIDSKVEKTTTIFFDLFKGGQFIKTVSKNINLPMLPGNYIYIDFGSLGAGSYSIKSRMEGYEELKYFTVSDELTVFAEFIEKTRFTTNKDIDIRIEVFDSSGEIALPVPDFKNNIKVDATLDDNIATFSSREVSAGVYEYTFNFRETGMFRANFEINKPGFPTVKVSKSHFVEEPRLLIVTKFGEIDTVKEYLLDFDVKNEEGALVSPDTITATFTASTAGITDVLSGRDISGFGGEYSITYFFDHIDTYKLEIFVEKTGFVADTSETLINVVRIGVERCGNNICESGEEISCPQDCPYKPQTNWIPWIILIVVIIIIGGFIVIVIKKKRG